jgi:uncharacterized damage-inducible protein DinB
VTTITPWFERRFDFSTPVALLPNLLTRLAGTPARLEDIVRAAAPAALTKQNGRQWSAQEQAGHLADLEPLWLARLRDYAAGREQLTVADLNNRKTDDARHDERAVKDILDELRTARGILVREARGVDGALLARTLPHPRLKTPMRLVDHLYFVAEHDDHHLAHIWGLLHE